MLPSVPSAIVGAFLPPDLEVSEIPSRFEGLPSSLEPLGSRSQTQKNPYLYESQMQLHQMRLRTKELTQGTESVPQTPTLARAVSSTHRARIPASPLAPA